jgi:hypothetical protein
MANPTSIPFSLHDLAVKIATDGPTKLEPAKRRVRGLVDGSWLFDTTDAMFVWEHPYCECHLLAILIGIDLRLLYRPIVLYPRGLPRDWSRQGTQGFT